MTEKAIVLVALVVEKLNVGFLVSETFDNGFVLRTAHTKKEDMKTHIDGLMTNLKDGIGSAKELL